MTRPRYRYRPRSARPGLAGRPFEVVRRFDGDGDLGARQVIDHRFRTAADQIHGVRLSAPESTPSPLPTHVMRTPRPARGTG